MKKCSNIVTAIYCSLCLIVTLCVSVSAAPDTTTTSYSSQGVITFDNGTTSSGDDVVFDAADFNTIDNIVTSGKSNVATAIKNATGKVVPSSNGTYAFSDLTSTIGSITNNGAVNKTIEVGDTYNIPAGYHNGSGVITPKGVGDASTMNVLAGKTFSNTSGVQTGTMVNNGGKTVNATTIAEDGDNAVITIPANAYYSTSSKLSVPIETIKNNIDIGKPEFAYDPVYKGNYNSNVHTISVNKDKYYMAVFRDANGAGRCNISKLTIDNVTITKSLGDSTNNVGIFWFKTNDTTITISGTTDAVAVFFVSELSNNPEYVKEFTSITYVARGFDHQTFTVPCSKYAMIISIGYQGTQSLSMTLTGESYNQEGFKSIKAYANHTGLNNCGYAHLICESTVDFEVVLCQRNNNLIYLS